MVDAVNADEFVVVVVHANGDDVREKKAKTFKSPKVPAMILPSARLTLKLNSL